METSGRGQIRGGSVFIDAFQCASSFRDSDGAEAWLPTRNLGFRVVLAIEELPEWVRTTPKQPTYGSCPERLPGKDSLIVVTHGRIPSGETPEESTAWVVTMTSTIERYLS